jgi:hypothetical protein
MTNSVSTKMKIIAGAVIVASTSAAGHDVATMSALTSPQYSLFESASEARSPWAQAPSADSLVSNLSKLKELAGLKANWDSYGADPITSPAIAMAGVLIAAVNDDHLRMGGTSGGPWMIAPSPDGGVQVEWLGPQRKIEVVVNPDGTLSYLIVDRTGVLPEYIEEHGVSLGRIQTLVALVVTV